MIKKLRIKFITASMLSLALVLLVILGGINAMSYRKTVADADAILSVLAASRGKRGTFRRSRRKARPLVTVCSENGALPMKPPMNPAFSPSCWMRRGRCSASIPG